MFWTYVLLSPSEKQALAANLITISNWFNFQKIGIIPAIAAYLGSHLSADSAQ